jgi:hypothetical protein
MVNINREQSRKLIAEKYIDLIWSLWIRLDRESVIQSSGCGFGGLGRWIKPENPGIVKLYDSGLDIFDLEPENPPKSCLRQRNSNAKSFASWGLCVRFRLTFKRESR